MAAVRELLCRRKGEKKQAWMDRRWLLSFVLDLNYSELILAGDRILTPKEKSALDQALRKRRKGIPLQYIAGEAEFYGRKLKVAKGVLIPRPETERLVERVLEDFKGDTGLRVLDIGAGSGAIAVTLKLERPDWSVSASDISSTALKLAKKNAQSLGADVKFYNADLLTQELAGLGFDLIVSNPPYLDFSRDKVSKEVKRFEPRLALEPGLKYKIKGVAHRGAWHGERILSAVKEMPQKPRAVYLELSPQVSALLERRWRRDPGVERIERFPDLAGRKRFLLVAWKHG